MNKYDVDKFHQRYDLIKKYLNKTPTIKAIKLSEVSDNEVYVKLENLQKSGSFKVRGALSKILSLSEAERKRGIIAASAGNHSQGVGYTGRMLNIDTTIVMPTTAPISKINATKNYGVNLVLHGDYFDDANAKALEISTEKDLVFIHAFNDEDVIIGQGSIGIEILEDVKDAEYIFVPVGGGGILAGIATYVKQINPNCKLIGVESVNVPSYYEARKNNEPLVVPANSSIADGIAVKKTGDKTFDLLQKYCDDVVLVSEVEISAAILFLFENCKIVAEGAGAVTTAAILFNKLNLKNKKIVAVLTGGNIDITTFFNIANRSLIAQGRRQLLEVEVPIGRNSLVRISEIAWENHIQIHKISESQFDNRLEINREKIKLVLDVNEMNQYEKMKFDIQKEGYKIL